CNRRQRRIRLDGVIEHRPAAFNHFLTFSQGCAGSSVVVVSGLDYSGTLTCDRRYERIFARTGSEKRHIVGLVRIVPWLHFRKWGAAMYVRRCFQLTLVTAWTILIPCVSLIFASEGTAASARSSKTSSAMRSPFKVEPFQESFPGAAAGTSENRAAGSRTLISLRQAQTFTVNDLNNEGIQDIVVADFLSDAFLVALGEGGGRFRPALVLPAGRGPRSVLSRDIDGDGVTDLVVA